MQVKVIQIKKDIEKELNTVIKKIEQAGFKVINIKVIKENQYLILYESPRQSNQYGYQKKQLSDSPEIAKATSKQLSYLKTLADKAGESIDTSNLTKRQAGILIGKLKKQASQSQSNHYQADHADIDPDFKIDDLNKLDL